MLPFIQIVPFPLKNRIDQQYVYTHAPLNIRVIELEYLLIEHTRVSISELTPFLLLIVDRQL